MTKQGEPKLLIKTRAAIRYAKKRPRFNDLFYDMSHSKSEPAMIFIDGKRITVTSYYGVDILQGIKAALGAEKGVDIMDIGKLLGTRTGYTIQLNLT